MGCFRGEGLLDTSPQYSGIKSGFSQSSSFDISRSGACCDRQEAGPCKAVYLGKGHLE